MCKNEGMRKKKYPQRKENIFIKILNSFFFLNCIYLLKKKFIYVYKYFWCDSYKMRLLLDISVVFEITKTKKINCLNKLCVQYILIHWHHVSYCFAIFCRHIYVSSLHI